MSLAMLLDLPAMIVPDLTVLVDTSTGSGADAREVTYGELRSAASQVAGLLAGLGVGPGDRVGFFATNRAELVEAMFGAALLGATVVPMNYRAGLDEARHLLLDSGAKVLFTESRYRDLVASVRPHSLTAAFEIDGSEYGEARDSAQGVWDPASTEDEDLAVILYTSGTTSLPKGVMLRHGALAGYVMGANDAADGEDHGRMLLAAPLYHVAGLTSTLNALYSGRVSVLLPQFEAGSWLAAVAQHQISHAFLVPTMLARVLDHPDLESADLSTLESLTYGAAPMPPSVIRRAIERFPANVGFSGSYGQTETTATVAVLDPDDHRITGTEDEKATKMRRLASVGRVLDDVAARVVSADTGEVSGVGVTGELQLRTERAMSGYWGNQEKTRVTIDDEGWVHTGDLGYLDDGDYLFLVGRAGDMIIRGGENIAPEEVEAVLYEHPDVLEAAVVGAPDETWGERVVGAVVLRAGASIDAVNAHCREHLASFKRPEVLLTLDELPRTSTGKLLRRDLLPILTPLLHEK